MLINIIYLQTLLWTLMYILTKICFSFVYLQFFFVLDLKTRKAPITVTGYSARFQTATCGTSSHAFICRNNLSMQRDRPITNGLLTSSRKLEKKKIKKNVCNFLQFEANQYTPSCEAKMGAKAKQYALLARRIINELRITWPDLFRPVKNKTALTSNLQSCEKNTPYHHVRV